MQPPSIRLTDAMDPGSRARKLASQWRVDHLIQTGARRENGQNMEIAPTALRRGDFVEVSVFVDIQMVRRKQQMGAMIRFSMREVVRLWGAEDARVSQRRCGVVWKRLNLFQRRLPRTGQESVVVHAAGPSTRSLVMPSIFNIGDGEQSTMEVD